MAAPSSEFEHLLNAHQDAIRAGCIADARSTANEILALAVQELEDDPEPDPDMILCAMARECEEQGDWEGAEAAYRERLLLDENPNFGRYEAHSSLAAFLRLIGRREEAFEHARLATAAARKADLAILLLMALKQEMRYLIELGDFPQAANMVSEMLGLLHEDRTQDQLRASVMVLRARLSFAKGDLAAAEADLKSAYELLTPLLEWEEAAGIHSTMVQWRATRARLEQAKGNLGAAKDHWIEAVAGARHVDKLEHCADIYTKATLARTLEHAAKALTECGCISESAAASSEAEHIWKDLKLPRRCPAAE